MHTRSKVEKAVALALAANASLALAVETADRELGEVVVTATRRTTSLQDAPVAVQVFTEATLRDLNLDSFEDYLRYTPNMQGHGSQPGQHFIEMRGVGAYGGNLAHAGTVGAKASVAVYVDDTPVSAGASGSRNFDMYTTDISRIEVLAGPQGTLFGSAAMSGAIRYITNKPDPSEFDARVAVQSSLTHGSDDLSYGVEAMVNLPIVTDRLALRIAGYDSFSAGYLDNTPHEITLAINSAIVNNKTGRYANTRYGVLNNYDFQKKDMNTAEYKGARVGASWQISDSWSFLAQYTLQNLDTEGPFYYREDLGDLKVERYMPEFSTDDAGLASWTLEGRIAALDLIYSGSYLERDIEQVSDYIQYAQSGGWMPYYTCDYPAYTYCEPPRTEWTVTSDLRTITHELRVSSDPANRLSFVVGAFHYQNGCAPPRCGTSIDFNYLGAIAQGIPQNAPLAAANSYISAPRKPGTMFFTDMSPIAKETSFFGDVTWRISNRWSASVGLRSYDIDQSATGSVNYGSRTNTEAGVNFDTNLKPLNDSDTVKRVNFTYSAGRNVRLYATYSEGFSTGGYNRTGGVPGLNGQTVPVGYDTERTVNYEVGWKATFANNRARFNGAVYRIDWEDIVVGVFEPAITNAVYFANAGRAEVHGIEGEVAYLFNNRWSVEGAFAITDSQFLDSPSEIPNMVPPGAQLARQPVLGGNLRVRYDFPLVGSRAYVMLGGIYEGSRWNGVSIARTKSPSYTTYDLNAGAKVGDNWDFKLYAQNLTDERYEIYHSGIAAMGWIYKAIGRPRTVGFSVSYDF